MDDGKAVGIDRAVGCLGQVIIHQPQEGRGQEKCNRIMTIPPLYQCILYAGIDGIAFKKGYGDLEAVGNMQHRNGYEGGNIKPDGHINMLHPALDDGTDHVGSENKPDHGNKNIDRPFQFGIFLAGGCAACKGNSCQYDDQLPSPEVDLAEQVVEHPGFAKPLE